MPRRSSFVLQAVICAAVILWQIYDLVAATEAQSFTLNLFTYFIIVCAGIGLLGALFGLRKPASPPPS